MEGEQGRERAVILNRMAREGQAWESEGASQEASWGNKISDRKNCNPTSKEICVNKGGDEQAIILSPNSGPQNL